MNVVNSDSVVKLSCIQTAPGMELSVATVLARYLTEKNCSHCVLKGLGAFDLILVYETPDTGPFLSKAGVIEGIRKSNLFYCYPESPGGAKDVITALRESRFAGFSFLKYGPDRHIRRSIDSIPAIKNGSPTHCLATIGWYELVAITPSATVLEFYRQLTRQNSSCSLSDGGAAVGLIKAFSFLGVNLYQGVLPGFPESEPTLEGILGRIREMEEFSSAVDPSLEISIRISCSPSKEAAVVGYWSSLGQVQQVLGKFDLCVRLRQGLRWHEVLSALLSFRQEHRDCLVGTDTQIAFEATCGEGQ